MVIIEVFFKKISWLFPNGGVTIGKQLRTNVPYQTQGHPSRSILIGCWTRPNSAYRKMRWLSWGDGP